ncbi:hypothetical protein TNCV_3790071 [Trichonephila clavipes]|nr:hypothetical protein TNCV_3790071 [Trichonephila clavipes]
MAITVFSDPRNLDYNYARIDISFGGYDVTVFSYYFEPSVNINLDLRKIEQLFANRVLKRLIWCMDANSKSEIWFSPVIDSRSIKLSEFFSTWQLFTINGDYGPTFSADQSTSYIDITAVGHNALGLNKRKPIILVTYTNEVFQEYKTVCFTDRSKWNGRAGLACVIYEEGVESFTFQHRLRDCDKSIRNFITNLLSRPF